MPASANGSRAEPAAMFTARAATSPRGARTVALLLATVFAFACGEDDPPPVKVAIVQIDPEALDLEVGESTTLQATSFDEAGQKLKAGAARWTSGDPSVASVDAEGTLVGVAVGETTITAAIGGKAGKASVRVIPAKVAIVSVEPAEARLFPDDTVQFEAAAFSAGGALLENRAAAWASDAPEVASVSDAGLVRARAPGAAEILVTVDGVTAAVQVKVVPRISVIRIEPERLVLFEGEEGSLVAKILGTNGASLEDREVAWTAADPEVARVEEGGAVVALRPGETAVYAEAEGAVGMAMVVVRARPASVRIEPPSLLLQIDTTWGLSAIVKDAIGDEHPGEGCTWASAAPEVIEIFADGSVHALAEGAGLIEVRCGGLRASIEATVIPRARFTIEGPEKVVVGEEPIMLEASMEGRPPRGPLRWAWGPPDKIDFDAGSVTGLLPGRPWVFASAEGRSVGRVVLSVLRFDELYGGPWATCGRIRDGRVFCWGDTRLYPWGQTASFPDPVPQPLAEPLRDQDFRFVTVSLGETFGNAITTDGPGTWGCATECYDESKGSEFYLQPSGRPVAAMSAGYSVLRQRSPPMPTGLSMSHSCTLYDGGAVSCGKGSIPGAFADGIVLPERAFVAVGAGLGSNCALAADGETWCWGRGGIDDPVYLDFQLGNGSHVPAPLEGVPAFVSITAGKYHHCGVAEAGAAWCWGHSREGALGAGFSGSSEAPVEV
ncbi:MAG TPA: Ig-like domain-containing protein, partial [Vulgatibacter sp.]